MIVLTAVRIERWPLASAFRISRGAKTEAEVAVVELGCLEATGWCAVGRGEATPYARYGETSSAVASDIVRAARNLPAQPRAARSTLLRRLPPGAARNALDCALWDLEAKLTGQPAHRLARLPKPRATATCYTLSLDTPAAMAEMARAHPHLPLLKLKLGAAGDHERMRAVRAARPDARLVVDANEGWQPADLNGLIATAAECAVELIEQPLPAGKDAMLGEQTWSVPICADESAAPGSAIAALADRYTAVNIKLDKTGGLSSAIAQAAEARRCGLEIMVGSMVATSLAMAPAMLLAAQARWIDLDSPLLLARDRPHGLTVADGIVAPADQRLWG